MSAAYDSIACTIRSSAPICFSMAFTMDTRGTSPWACTQTGYRQQELRSQAEFNHYSIHKQAVGLPLS